MASPATAEVVHALGIIVKETGNLVAMEGIVGKLFSTGTASSMAEETIKSLGETIIEPLRMKLKQYEDHRPWAKKQYLKAIELIEGNNRT